jgi:hypothetical protein
MTSALVPLSSRRGRPRHDGEPLNASLALGRAVVKNAAGATVSGSYWVVICALHARWARKTFANLGESMLGAHFAAKSIAFLGGISLIWKLLEGNRAGTVFGLPVCRPNLPAAEQSDTKHQSADIGCMKRIADMRPSRFPL